MTMRHTSNQPIGKLTETRVDREERFKVERRQDMLILLEHLSHSQEATVKMILACLYDIGTINFANNRIAFGPLNRMLKSIAKYPKPLAIVIGFWWFKKHCPGLIAKWLSSQIEFKPLKLPKKVEEGLGEVDATSNLEMKVQEREVKQLRSQVRLLAGGLVLAIAFLGGTTAWLGYKLQLAQTPAREVAPKARLYDSP
ncbi:MAG: hypothetical protein SW833_20560 [Cyanobacteriota bacterium]|nr:hypothetical protein [Cyanobacteriota bacterium]